MRESSPNHSTRSSPKNSFGGSPMRLKSLKKKNKSSIKFKINRNSSVFNSIKQFSHEMLRRKACRRTLKGSPELLKSFRLNQDIQSEVKEYGCIELHPVQDESSSSLNSSGNQPEYRAEQIGKPCSGLMLACPRPDFAL